MSGERLEQLFERFRRDGEADALGEVFDATASDLLRVARRITRDRAEAEDLVQATFLAAIERAASFDSDRALKPWLVGILVRQAGLARRRVERTRVLHENLTSKTGDPSDALADREFAEALARALERLTPAEREVLVPLLLDEKRAVEIARELEKRPDTVHTRVHRGLARLRKLLPAGFGLGLAASFLQRRALAHIKREVMNMARQSICTSSIASTTAVVSPFALGGSFLASKLVLAALLVAASAALVSIARPWEWLSTAPPHGSLDPTLPEASKSARLDAPPASTTPNGDRTPLGRGASASSIAALAAPTPSQWMVRGRLNGLQSGEALTSTLKIEPLSAGMAVGGLDPGSVSSIGVSGGTLVIPTITAAIPSNGVFEVDVSSLFAAQSTSQPHELGLTVDHPRYLISKSRILVEKGVIVTGSDGQSVLELHCDLDLHLAAVVRGQVFAPTESTAPSFNVSIHRMNGNVPDTSPEDGTSVASGAEFRLRVASGSTYVVLASTEDSAPATIPVVTSIGEELALPATHLEAGLAISGTVTAGGVAQTNARVLASASGPPTNPQEIVRSSFHWTAQGFSRIAGSALTDAQGRFTIHGLVAGEFGVATLGCAYQVDAFPLLAMDFPRVAVVAPAENVAVPLSCAIIQFHLLGVDPAPNEVTMTMTDPQAATVGTTAHWTPVKRIGFAPNREARMSFRIEGYEPISASYTFPGPGGERDEFLQFVPNSSATLRVHLTTQAGERIPQAAFGFFAKPTASGHVSTSPLFSREAEGSDGVFVLDAIRSGDYEVRVHTDGTFDHYAGYYRESGFDVVLPSGADETRTLTMTLGGRIRANVVSGSSQQFFAAKLLDAAGVESKTNFCHSEVNFEDVATWTSSPGHLSHGTNDTFPNLEPGQFRLQVNRDPRPPLVVPVDVVAGATTEVTVDLDAP